MKLFRKNVFSLVGIMVMLLITTTGYSFYENSNQVKDAGTFYKDVPEAKDSLLGAANYFHVFANKANLRNHTNGNVATKELSGDSNFGTQGISGTEYHYIQQVHSINGASGIRDHTKMVFGTGVSIDLSEYHRPKVNGKQMDRVSGDNVFQDKPGNVYIDFEAEFKKLNQASEGIITHDSEKTYYNSDFKNINERVIDVSQYKGNNVYIKVAPEVLEANTPLRIAGLEKNSGSGQFKNVYITVDTGNTQSYTVSSQIIFRYTDGTERGNKETTDFSDSTVLWTFERSGKPYTGNINLRSTWVGSILAPSAVLNGEQNIDGNIIVDEFKGAGETHSWHWQQNKGGVILEKSEEGNEANFLKGAEFSLYTSENILVKDKLVTNDQGQIKVDNLPLGKYYFKETKAPVGYELSTKHYDFEVTANSTSKVTTVKATNKKELGQVELQKTDVEDGRFLEGAEFSIFTSEGKLVRDKLVTDAKGQLKVEDLPVGKYYFVETKAPAGYELSKKHYEFEIKAGETSKIAEVKATNKKELGKVELQKTDIADGKFLEGAEFSIFTSEGKLVRDKLVTDAQGQLKVENLPVGKYYFVETKAPAGYELSKKHYEFEIKAGETSKIEKIEATNKKELGKVELQKTDITDGKFLEGAEFSLFTSTGELVKDKLVTNAKGQLKVENLPVGKYYFVETKAPAGYELSKKHYEFEIKVGETSQVEKIGVTNKKENPKLGGVELRKIDANDKTSFLSGAEFSLYDGKTNKLIKEKIVTGKDGKVVVNNLTPGSYYFIETKAPVGYKLNEEKIHFIIEAEKVNELEKVTVENAPENEPEYGAVTLRKVDSNDQTERLKGAQFSLFDSKTGKLIKANIETAQNGELTVDKLIPGNYYFVETKAPTGYEISTKKYTFEIKAGSLSKLNRVTVTNEKEEEFGSVELKKMDQTDKSIVLAGAEFSLFNSTGDLLQEKLTTDEAGKLKVDNLAVGSYYFKETKAPAGYKQSTELYHFEIKANDISQVTYVEVTNEKEKPKLGSVELEKADEDNTNKVLSDAEFALYNSTGELVKGNLSTDETGKLRVDDLAEGKYYFVETKAPIGYEISTEQHHFEVIADNKNDVVQIKVTNKKEETKLGSVELKKVDVSNPNFVLPGAEFSLYQSNGTLLQSGLVTNESGVLRVDGLAEGSYYFIETKAPNGYSNTSKKQTFEIKVNETTQVAFIQVTNQKIDYKGSVILVKTDQANNQTLSGAEFSLYKSTGELVHANLITDSSGQLKVENLAEGSYYFVETKAPLGYILSTKQYGFEIKANETSEIAQVAATNQKEEVKLGSVELQKFDALNKSKVLAGAEFSLYQSDGTVLQTGLITDESGLLRIDGLAEGSYYFVETKAPAGYSLSGDNQYDFEIKADTINKVQRLEVLNEKDKREPVKGSVILRKIDASDSNKVLQSAEFSLYHSTGELIDEGLTTDEAGILTKKNLAVGDYYFKETKAPKGYKLSNKQYDFKIEADKISEVKQVEVTNEKEEEETKLGSVELKKIDVKDKTKVLSGAKFKLYNSNGVEIKLDKSKLITDLTGKLHIDKLPEGKYYFLETEAPTGYKLSNKKHHFEIEADKISEVKRLEVTNEKEEEETKLGSVELKKIDVKDKTKVLSGAKFKLYNSNGVEIKLDKSKLITDQTGKLHIDKLPEGKYYFLETEAPAGYKLSNKKHHFEIKADKISEVKRLEVTNEKEEVKQKLGSVELKKVDSSNSSKVLQGAEFSLYHSNGKLIKENLPTDKNGLLTVPDLKEGEYYFIETKAPTGYILSQEKHFFTIKVGEKASIEKITVTNEAKPVTPKEPDKPNKPTSGGTTTTKKMLPKTGEVINDLFVYGWTILLMSFFMLFWKKKKNQELN